MSGTKRAKSTGTGFLLLLLIVMGISAIPGRAQVSAQAQFDEANEYLDSGNYRQALSIYKSILSSQQVSGPLFLNMGISYVQLDSLGMAKYYFLKAWSFEETHNRAEEGLQYVSSRFSRQSAVLPKLPWERFFDWLGSVTGPASLLGIGILLLNAGVCAFIAGWFFPSASRPLQGGGIGTAILSVLVILSSFYLQHVQNRYSPAVMVHQQADVLEQPAPDATLISQAYEGYTFTVDHSRSRQQPGWSYVRMSNGLYGWIPNSEIMIL
ncbi:tetratricopeptide repeat protein [Halalkalibaculum sp. DA384]|uniref:tetratricopeptide repeat protein n=1 Tax=Halalkalibaculum sp. DA384 TaxID=3373606 RepID=UPI00375461F3